MGTTKNGKIKSLDISLYGVEGQYSVGCFVMLIFYGEGGIHCPYFAPKSSFLSFSFLEISSILLKFYKHISNKYRTNIIFNATIN